ncbi:jg2270 [Pararge aegeria aegeria]|uniref:Jg2270 protein n=1 Tax=Pararge aegeria aegeria TaxID=348720 RepID=A0A8S4RQ94_9NEOP|nr:jg2270 [Pararge aegeria aegeria]
MLFALITPLRGELRTDGISTHCVYNDLGLTNGRFWVQSPVEGINFTNGSAASGVFGALITGAALASSSGFVNHARHLYPPSSELLSAISSRHEYFIT